MEHHETAWEKISMMLAGFLGIIRVLVEAVILTAFGDLLTRWFGITFGQALILLLTLYFFIQVRYLVSEFQLNQNLREFFERMGEGPGPWDDYDPFEEEEPEPPRRHLTPVYPFGDRRRQDDKERDR